MHDEQQRLPDARTQQVLNRVRHIINKKNTQFMLKALVSGQSL